jgi:hypothetical protein
MFADMAVDRRDQSGIWEVAVGLTIVTCCVDGKAEFGSSSSQLAINRAGDLILSNGRPMHPLKAASRPDPNSKDERASLPESAWPRSKPPSSPFRLVSLGPVPNVAIAFFVKQQAAATVQSQRIHRLSPLRERGGSQSVRQIRKRLPLFRHYLPTDHPGNPSAISPLHRGRAGRSSGHRVFGALPNCGDPYSRPKPRTFSLGRWLLAYVLRVPYPRLVFSRS